MSKDTTHLVIQDGLNSDNIKVIWEIATNLRTRVKDLEREKDRLLEFYNELQESVWKLEGRAYWLEGNAQTLKDAIDSPQKEKQKRSAFYQWRTKAASPGHPVGPMEGWNAALDAILDQKSVIDTIRPQEVRALKEVKHE